MCSCFIFISGHRYVEVYDACGGMGMSGGGGPMRRARPPMPPRGGEYPPPGQLPTYLFSFSFGILNPNIVR